MPGQCNIYTSAALETVSQVTGAADLTGTTTFKAYLLGMVFENTSAATGWIQVFDGYGTVTNGAVPIVSIKVAATTQSSFGSPVIFDIPVKKGIMVALSSTGPTYTAVTNSLFVTAWWTGP
jgi:hypothetical protein